MAEMLLTLNEVVARLKLSRATIYRLVGQGKLRSTKIGKSVRFREKEIDTFIAGSESKTSPAAPPSSSPRTLLQFARTWAGDDLDQCLQAVYQARGESRF